MNALARHLMKFLSPCHSFVLTPVPALLGPRLQWLVVMTHVLAPLGPLLLLLIVMTHVLAPLAPLLQWLISWCRLFTLVLTLLAPLLQWLISQCQLIALVHALQDCHAFVLENEPFFVSLLVYHRKNDSFNHVMLHNNSLSDKYDN